LAKHSTQNLTSFSQPIFISTRSSAMGRGDKRSRKGKIFKGSYGNVRPHRLRTFVAPVAVAAATAVKAAPKTAAKKKA
jgi:30S ribosomal protein S31